MTERDCPFCQPAPERVCYQGRQVFAMWDAYAVTPGHCLLIPRRHVASWWEATDEERAELTAATVEVKRIIDERHRPDGYNLGLNAGEAAGQTVGHLHLHLIPRYRGDVEDPRGGVRAVIPGKANYLADSLADAPHSRSLVQGGDDPFYPHLRHALERADQVDLAISFVLRSGWKLLENHVRDVLMRGGRVRLLTGDYLDVTDPEALEDVLLLSQEVGGLEARVFEARQATFHPKCYLVRRTDGLRLAFVGSSNLSGPALGRGIEWNYRALSSRDPDGLVALQQAFEELYTHPATRPLEYSWIDRYRLRRAPLQVSESSAVRAEQDPPEAPPEPHGVQLEALKALKQTRQEGNRAGLVVLATGLGKTWLAAFDSRAFRRVLFVAHREEILGQAMRTFRRIRPRSRCGTYKGDERDTSAELLFASVQTLGRQSHLDRFPSDRFDYIVVDEFHHAAAATYRRLLDHFTPRFLLGLTATPERTDGGDLLGLCGENLVFRRDMLEGIRQGLLCPFHYYGVPDEVDYSNIPWRSHRFDPEELTRAVATEARASNALDQYRARAGQRTVAFCCSVTHARFMSDFFRQRGQLRTAAVHSEADSDPRAASLEKLAAGELDVVFAVDMFNEGVDLPSIDTVMMLRPTESKILWLQQFGRGLRRAEGKERLTVIDYIGNHRTFLLKPQTLFDLPAGDAHLARVLNLFRTGQLDLPPGCAVTYDLKAVEILEGLLRPGQDTLKLAYQDLRQRQGTRPAAAQMFHEGYNPRSLRQQYGSWLGLVQQMGDLTDPEEKAWRSARGFLDELETTPITKMLLLQALLETGTFPGEIGLDQLTAAFARVASRSARLRRDVPLDDGPALRQLVADQARASEWGELHQEVFHSRVPGASQALIGLTRELVEWRLAEYLRHQSSDTSWLIKVNHTGGRPILFPLDRSQHPGLPLGPSTVEVDGEPWTFRFVKVAVNVAEQPGHKGNRLPDLLHLWFGARAGQPGTGHRVRLDKTATGYSISPVAPRGD